MQPLETSAIARKRREVMREGFKDTGLDIDANPDEGNIFFNTTTT